MRVTNLRGVNLNVFDFDYDLTWVGFFMNADQHVYGRYGGRDSEHAEEHLTVPGLKHAMAAALAAYRANPNAAPARAIEPVRTPEQYPASRRLKEGSCIHCHHVYDFRRDALRSAGKWSLEQAWVYPSPENVGLVLDAEVGGRIREVKADSPAFRAGLRSGDVLRKLNATPVASFADAQYALHQAPPMGEIAVEWERKGKRQTATVSLPAGWRKGDISWRASMWGLEPTPAVHGKDLTPEEKRKLGLAPDRLAFRQGNFVTKQARAIGIRERDIILGIDGKEMRMTMLQFNAWVRINHQIGDRIMFNIIRNGQHLDLPMVLKPRASF